MKPSTASLNSFNSYEEKQTVEEHLMILSKFSMSTSIKVVIG